MNELGLFDELDRDTYPFTEPDALTDTGRILQALRWAMETRYRSGLEVVGDDAEPIPPGAVTGIDLANICIDYRRRLCDLRDRFGIKVETVEFKYKDWRGKTRRMAWRRLMHYAEQLPPGYQKQDEPPW